MRRADRLSRSFRCFGAPETPDGGRDPAELETSKRTIYRDITTLIEQRVPIPVKPAWVTSGKGSTCRR
jgi:predicted DNA-binding transcriptional regulator YafY